MQRIERGEIIDTGYEGFFRVRADGKDEISSLPRHVALRVSKYNVVVRSSSIRDAISKAVVFVGETIISCKLC